MRIIVTGGAGFIGSNLVRALLAEGHDVVNFDKLTYAGNLSSLADVAGHPGYRFVRKDICDPAAVREILSSFRPDALLHLAAESHVDRSIDGPMDFVRTNVTGTATLLMEATDYWKQSGNNFRFIHVSTDEVYGSLGNEGRFVESSPYAPRSPYSASKAASDHFAKAWHETYGLPVIVTHCSNNYGPYQFPEKLIPVVILKSLAGEPIPVYGDGTNVRDWIHVEDAVSALSAVVRHGRTGETYNIGADAELRNIDLVRMVCAILDEELGEGHAENLITFVADRPGHDFRYALDTSKIRGELGWEPRFQPAEGLRRTVRWYLENRGWWQEILGGCHVMNRRGLG
jgi:dTDP-glucose 4,6-dehydratase